MTVIEFNDVRKHMAVDTVLNEMNFRLKKVFDRNHRTKWGRKIDTDENHCGTYHKRISGDVPGFFRTILSTV